MIAFCLLVAGCATTTLESDSVDGIPDDIAVIVMTAGSVNKNAFAVSTFVSYRVVNIDQDGNVIFVEFIPAEKVLLTRPNGVIGKGKYGFLHVFEVAPGRYYLVGIRGRGYDMTVPVGGIYATVDAGNLGDTEILLGFDASGGTLNYLGEVLFTGGELTNTNITVSDYWDRDRETAIRDHKQLSGYSVVKPQIDKVDVDDLTGSERHPGDLK